MKLKEAILKKIKIIDAAVSVADSLKSSAESKIDKQNAIFLLEAAGYKHEHLRDLDLYYKGIDEDRRRIIVLDSEFAIYNTSLKDVAIRKSPSIKEMLSFGNVKKILWDEGVIVQKKAGTVETIKKEALETQDIIVTKKEVEEIMYQSMASIAEKDEAGIMEGLIVLAELLEWSSPKFPIKTPAVLIKGKSVSIHESESQFGPAVVYGGKTRQICLTNEIFNIKDPDERSLFEKFTSGCEGAEASGEDVFRRLKDMVQTKYRI